MVLTRSDKDNTTGDGDPASLNSINATTPFVDQNQTYTSHPSHQVFLREYTMVEVNGSLRPVATGKLIKGGNGGMATWADVKAQAADMLGIQLTDADVGQRAVARAPTTTATSFPATTASRRS